MGIPSSRPMQTPPLPPDESFRLEVLRSLRVLDTPAEERFDRITRAAAHFFGVPIALVSLVDASRQWFKSRYGLEAAETPRDVSFCGHAILASGPLLVEDALRDERFADNPLVVGPPFVRFYAGVPLRGPGNAPLGTLCVVDRVPRAFSPADAAFLMDMAAWAEMELVRGAPGSAPEDGPGRWRHSRLLLEALPDLLLRLDREGVCLEVITRDPLDFPGSGGPAAGRRLAEFLPPAEAAAGLQALGEVLGTGEARTVEYRLALGGREGDFEVRLVPCGPGQALGIVRNVSARREAERAKERFLHTASHELRTPLSSIRGSLELLLSQAGMPARARELAALAHANAVRLARMVDDILGQARQGRMVPSVRASRLDLLVDQAREAVRTYRESFDVALAAGPVPEGAEVLVDTDWVVQILVNLLSNAVKYSPPGEAVVLAIQPSPRGWTLAVEDHGPGIPEAFQARIFREFAQAGGPHQQPGSGLGLSISRSLAEAMGGALEFESRPGRTVFRLDLPAVGRALAPAPQGALRAILHVEDDDVVCGLLAEALEGVARVDRARTLAEARERLPGGDWALAVLDGRLPDGAGPELLPALREACGDTFPVLLYAGDDAAPPGFAHIFIKGRCGPDEIRRVILGILGEPVS